MALLPHICWRLAPEVIQDWPFKDPDRTRLEQLYNDCHQAVFDKPASDSLTRWPDCRELETKTEELGCSLRTFITTLMLAHSMTAPDRPFFARELLTENAISRFTFYQKACREQFGHFDISTLEVQYGRKFVFIDTAMERSEQIFAEWLVGFGKIHETGDQWKTEVFRIREEAYDPLWLATEPLYVPVIVAHIKADVSLDAQTLGLRRHRHNVIQALRKLKKTPSMASYAFTQRESIMPAVCRKVLKLHNFSDGDFSMNDFPGEPIITQASQFWVLLGRMIRNRLVQTVPGIEAQLKPHAIRRSV